jgi:arginase
VSPASRWTIVGAPLDSAGMTDAEARAPAALRAAGLVEALGSADAGDIAARIGDRERDAESGVIGLADHRVAAAELGSLTAGVLRSGRLPLVIGGDCSLLLGVYAGLAQAGREPGLWLIDGHPDFYDGHGSPTGEVADMEMSALTGHGPAELLEAAAPLDPAAVVVLGHRRPELGPDVADELARVPPEMATLDATAVAERGADEVGRWAESRLAGGGEAWLHVDLDVLDAGVFPAVSYPQPEGLDWEALMALLEPLAHSPALIGASIADLNPERDPDGRYAREVVERLAPLLAGA